MNDPVNYYDPTRHFTITALIISFVTSVVFEIIEDAMDGELFTDDSHNGWDYLGAGISGFFGGISGGLAAQAIFSAAGGLADAAISGNLTENGFWNTMGNVAVSTLVSIGAGSLSKYLCSKFKVNSLNKLTKNFANRKLSDMEINVKMGSNIVKNGGLARIIRSTDDWIGNIVADYGASSILGGITSMVWSHIFDGRWF